MTVAAATLSVDADERFDLELVGSDGAVSVGSLSSTWNVRLSSPLAEFHDRGAVLHRRCRSRPARPHRATPILRRARRARSAGSGPRLGPGRSSAANWSAVAVERTANRAGRRMRTIKWPWSLRRRPVRAGAGHRPSRPARARPPSWPTRSWPRRWELRCELRRNARPP